MTSVFPATLNVYLHSTDIRNDSRCQFPSVLTNAMWYFSNFTITTSETTAVHVPWGKGKQICIKMKVKPT